MKKKPTEQESSDSANIRKAIKNRLDEVGENTLWLANRMEEANRTKRAQVYAFLSGRGDMRTDNIEWIMDLLGLAIVTVRGVRKVQPKPATPPKMPLD